MFEVTSHKQVSTTVTGDFRYKVWIVEARSRSNADTAVWDSVLYAVHLRPLNKGAQAPFGSDKQKNPEEQISDI
jgi:hypothetical protein